MSVHSLKAKRRHPEAPRDRFQVGHLTFEISESNGTFALIAGDALTANDRKPLFSGFIEPGMATQLRKVAHRFDDVEAAL